MLVLFRHDFYPQDLWNSFQVLLLLELTVVELQILAIDDRAFNFFSRSICALSPGKSLKRVLGL